MTLTYLPIIIVSWNSQIDNIASKANRILGLIRRLCRGWRETGALKILFWALVRSQVEYYTYTSINIDKIERIHSWGEHQL